MDIEAEIRKLKLRVDALEATLRPTGATPSRPRARRRRMNFPAQNCTSMEDLHADVTTATIDVAEVKIRIKDLQAELAQDISALNDEIGGFRRQTNDHFAKFRSQTRDQHDSIHHRLADLGLMIERLLKRLDA
ncbi:MULTISPECIES: hypothetical protein [unclassified Nonomuraea]|uniref:hypothetical protein n=1 Tax=unclassified Nonomuraea TaxID=2593643 RepID=UPI0035C01218